MKKATNKKFTLNELMLKLAEYDDLNNIFDIGGEQKYIILVNNFDDAESHVIFSNTYDKFFSVIKKNHDHEALNSCDISTTDASVTVTITSSPPDDDRGSITGNVTIYNINHAQRKKIKSKLLNLYADVDDLEYSSE
jgi:uncharacterized protein YydD (DUF2326 family)